MGPGYYMCLELGGPGYLQLGYNSTYKPIITQLTLLGGLRSGL